MGCHWVDTMLPLTAQACVGPWPRSWPLPSLWEVLWGWVGGGSEKQWSGLGGRQEAWVQRA